SLQVSARPSRSRCPCAPLRASASFLGPHPARRSRSALDLTGDEGLELRAALRVLHLDRRGLHEVRRGREDRAADAAVLRDLRGTDGVDDDAGGVGGVPHLELVLQVQRDLAEDRKSTRLNSSHVKISYAV